MPLARLRQGQHTGGGFTLLGLSYQTLEPLFPLAEPAMRVQTTWFILSSRRFPYTLGQPTYQWVLLWQKLYDHLHLVCRLLVKYR